MKATSSVTRGAAGMDRRPTEAETAAALDRVIERYVTPSGYGYRSYPAPPPETPINVTHGVAEVAAWQAEDEITPRRWRWKNLRSCSVAVHLILLPWDWRVSARRSMDYCEFYMQVQFGPVSIKLSGDIGNCSTGDWRAWFGLSEDEAWERSK
jgi:hypothetical protein